MPLARQAAEQGCHLFIEKPLSSELDGTEALQRAIEARGLVALVGCNMRFHPALMKVKQLLDERLVGRVVSVRVQAGQYLPDWHPWEDYRQTYSAQRTLGGGVILDAIHEIDYVRWMLGEVEAVSCFAGKLSHLEVETEDVAAILLRFIDGAIAEVHLDYVQRAYSRTGDFIGDEGTIRWDYSAGEVRWFSAKNGDWTVYRNPDAWTPNQMYVDEIRHFIACLDGREKPSLDVTEATRVLAVALAAKTAAQEGKVVRLRHETQN
jgi:predicted dehydrogenase